MVRAKVQNTVIYTNKCEKLGKILKVLRENAAI